MNIGTNKIEQIIYLMQTDKSVDAPADSLDWSKNIFRTRAVAEEPETPFFKKILAVLQMDLSPDRAAFGERSAPAAQGRQMLFEAGENSLDLRITETEQGLNIRGQILGSGFANAIVKFGNFETKSDHLSEFKLTGLPPGNYDLTLTSDEEQIVVEGLDLG